MRKFFIIFLAICLCLPLSIALATVEAGGDGSSTGDLDLNTIFQSTSLLAIINQAIGVLWVIAVPLSVIMIVWAGIELVSSGGDSKKVASARNRIKYTLIGLVVMILASSVVALVQNVLIQEDVQTLFDNRQYSYYNKPILIN